MPAEQRITQSLDRKLQWIECVTVAYEAWAALSDSQTTSQQQLAPLWNQSSGPWPQVRYSHNVDLVFLECRCNFRLALMYLKFFLSPCGSVYLWPPAPLWQDLQHPLKCSWTSWPSQTQCIFLHMSQPAGKSQQSIVCCKRLQQWDNLQHSGMSPNLPQTWTSPVWGFVLATKWTVREEEWQGGERDGKEGQKYRWDRMVYVTRNKEKSRKRWSNNFVLLCYKEWALKLRAGFVKCKGGI